MLAVSAGVLAYSIRDVKKNFNESRVPLMGVAGAFVFAAQMINFAIPGTGSSGHIAGAVLLAALLGPASAFIVMAGVLLIQAIFFADGGLLAWGCNLFNMGFFGCFLAYPYIFRPIAGKNMTRGRVFAGAVVASVAALELGAFSVTLETLLSGITKLPFGVFAAAMMPIHLAIGIGEGLATGAVLLFVRKNLLDTNALHVDDAKPSMRRFAWVLGLAALVIGGGLSLLASGDPDGLEWSMEKVAGSAELESSGSIHAFFAKMAEKIALLPDYAFPDSDTWFGTTFSGIVGAAVCALVLVIIGTLLCRKAKKEVATK